MCHCRERFRCQTVLKNESFSSVKYELWRKSSCVRGVIISLVTKRHLVINLTENQQLCEQRCREVSTADPQTASTNTFSEQTDGLTQEKLSLLSVFWSIFNEQRSVQVRQAYRKSQNALRLSDQSRSAVFLPEKSGIILLCLLNRMMQNN